MSWETWRPVVLAAAALFAAALLGVLTTLALTRFARRERVLRELHDSCYRSYRATLAVLFVRAAEPAMRLAPDTDRAVRHVLSLALIAAGAWLFVKLTFVVEDAALLRVRVDVSDNRRARRLRTQVGILRRLTAAVVTVIALAAMLMTFPSARAFGTSILASAGLAGIVAGLAAQTTLGNVFAGIQIALTDAVRLDDVVVVENEWGRVEELTLTYVVVHLWDERRLILPTSYFTTTPFQNWTRSEARVLGSVILYVDYRVPVEELRQELRRIIDGSPLWDRRDWVLQVTDTTESTVQLRALVSSADAPSSWDLRCEVREKLIAWLREHHPGALPRTRVEAGELLAAPDGDGHLDAERTRDFTAPQTGRGHFA